MTTRHIAISGELGSGKSSVARRLAERYGMRHVSTGELQRSLAATRQISTLEMNLLAESDDKVDEQIDGVLVDLGDSPEPIIFDSRMAWHFVPAAFKVHLLADPIVAAQRLLAERTSPIEGYRSLADAREGADKRYESERRRFQDKYDVDVTRLRNYDLIVDASDASIDAVTHEVAAAHEALGAYDPSVAPRCDLRASPRRVLPGIDPAGSPAGPDVVVAYARPFLIALEGQAVIDQAVRDALAVVPARLLAEGADLVADGLDARQYLATVVRPDWVYAWEDTHGFRFSTYPDHVPER